MCFSKSNFQSATPTRPSDHDFLRCRNSEGTVMSKAEEFKELVALPGEAMHEAWQRSDARLEADVGEYWRETGILPSGTTIESRLKELVAVAYVGDKLAGMTTTHIGNYAPLRNKLAFLRITVLPDYRLHYLQIRLSVKSKQIMAAYAKRSPSEGIGGIATVRQADYQATRQTPPCTPSTKSTLIGYNANHQQVRVNWFEHTRV